MTSLVANLSISKRYTLFVMVVIAVLLAASYQITSYLISDGMHELYVQRLQRCESVLNKYADAHFIAKASEIDAVVTSPRFVAAVATKDQRTIANEAPYYQSVLGATVFELFDLSGNRLYSAQAARGEDSLRLSKVLSQPGTAPASDLSAHYLLNGHQLYELYESDILTYDGLAIGRLIAGTVVSDFLVNDLESLTGFDIIVSYGDLVVASSESRLVEELLSNRSTIATSSSLNSQVASVGLGAGDVLMVTEANSRLNASVTFVGLPDQQIAPIMGYVKFYLIGLALVGGLLTLIVVYYYTSRRIGHQVSTLVRATRSISEGDLSFELKTDSNDEFGALSGAIERMRNNLEINHHEIQQLHQERLQSERMASLGKSATGIIHDFKSPMAVIRGTVELLGHKRKDDPDLARRLKTIALQIDQMDELTQDVIAFSRGKFNLSLESVDLGLYFAEIQQRHKEPFASAGIEFSIDGTESLKVKLDRSRFRRVIDNLLNNAREALKPAQKVWIDWQLTDSGLELLVADNGPGIPQEIIDTIFEPFVTSGKETGTGLGLAISSKIVEDHGAAISVSSTPDQGTEFKIVIPDSMVDRADQEKSEKQKEIAHEI